MKSIKLIATLMLAPFLFFAGSAFADETSKKETEAVASKKPMLTYYYFDGWVLCSKITVIVNDLKKKHSAELEMKAVKVGDGDSMKEIENAKLKSHGIVAKDKDGKLIAKVDGHSYGKPKVEEVINKLLGKKKAEK